MAAKIMIFDSNQPETHEELEDNIQYTISDIPAEIIHRVNSIKLFA